MKPLVKRSLRIAIPLVLAAFFGWYTFYKLPVKEFLPYFRDADYIWVWIGVVLGVLSHLSRAYRWRYTLEPLGYKPRLWNCVMAVFIAYLANFGIPRSGEVLRAAVMTNYEGVNFQKGFGTIVAERIADVLTMGLVILLALFLEFDYVMAFFTDRINLSTLLLTALFGGIAVALLFLYLKTSYSNTAQKIKTFVKGLMDGILSIVHMRRKWSFIGHTLFIWTLYILMFYATSYAVSDLDEVPFSAILIGFISASFSIAATNGGIFIYPIAIAAAFSVFDIPQTPSLAFGWIVWASQTLMLIVLGSLSFIFLPIYNRKK